MPSLSLSRAFLVQGVLNAGSVLASRWHSSTRVLWKMLEQQLQCSLSRSHMLHVRKRVLTS